MSIALVMPESPSRGLKRALQSHLPGVAIDLWPDLAPDTAYPMAVAWNPPEGSLAAVTGLKALHSLGAGVDALLNDRSIPAELPIARIVDPDLSEQMAQYTLLALLAHQRHVWRFAEQQSQAQWRQAVPLSLGAVGILGLGEIGCTIAERLLANGYSVHGWSRSAKQVEGVVCHHGEQGLHDLCQQVDALVCVLPLTDQTRGLINQHFLDACRDNLLLINIARGALLDESALLGALDKGKVARAVLDVFEREPLEPSHAFWTHPAVVVTPHVAGLTNPKTATAQIVDNYHRLLAGRPLLRLVDRQRGY